MWKAYKNFLVLFSSDEQVYMLDFQVHHGLVMSSHQEKISSSDKYNTTSSWNITWNTYRIWKIYRISTISCFIVDNQTHIET